MHANDTCLAARRANEYEYVTRRPERLVLKALGKVSHMFEIAYEISPLRHVVCERRDSGRDDEPRPSSRACRGISYD